MNRGISKDLHRFILWLCLATLAERRLYAQGQGKKGRVGRREEGKIRKRKGKKIREEGKGEQEKKSGE